MEVVRVALAVLVRKSHWWTPSFILQDNPTSKSNQQPDAGQGSRQVTNASQNRDAAISSRKRRAPRSTSCTIPSQFSKRSAYCLGATWPLARFDDRWYLRASILDASRPRLVASI